MESGDLPGAASNFGLRHDRDSGFIQQACRGVDQIPADSLLQHVGTFSGQQSRSLDREPLSDQQDIPGLGLTRPDELVRRCVAEHHADENWPRQSWHDLRVATDQFDGPLSACLSQLGKLIEHVRRRYSVW